jgi:hypothetical protein
MNVKPILFSGPMVRAIIEGRKTKTRRVITKGLEQQVNDLWHCYSKTNHRHAGSYDCTEEEVKTTMPQFLSVRSGDWLWVRETFSYVGGGDPGFLLLRADDYTEQCDNYGFDKPYPDPSTVKWKPSIFMPKHASRLSLLVCGVKVERLQDISESDAAWEGCRPYFDYQNTEAMSGMEGAPLKSPVDDFKRLWDSINGKTKGKAWADNPWVMEISFIPELENIERAIL